MTTSKQKAKVGMIKGIVAPSTEGYIDITQLHIGNKTLGAFIHDFVVFQDTVRQVITRLEDYKTALKEFLVSRGYQLSSYDIESLITDLRGVHTLNPNDKHQVALLHEGYVKEVIDIDLVQILRNIEVPSDLHEGYYKIENGQLVVDEIRKEEQEGLE